MDGCVWEVLLVSHRNFESGTGFEHGALTTQMADLSF